MKTQTTTSRGQELLAQMGQIPVIVQGKLSERRQGDKVTGQKLQRWRNGRNQTIHIPAEKYDTIRQGTEGYREFARLAQAYVETKEREALQRSDPGKKKPMKR